MSPSTSTSVTSQAYILAIASINNHYATSESAPSNLIRLFDKSTLRHVQTLPGHDRATTHLRTVDNGARPFVISSGRDGTVKIWDERSTSATITLTTPEKPSPLLCCDLSKDGLTLAAGSVSQEDDACILYWDPRNPASPLRVHSSTHSDDITAVHFSPPPRTSAGTTLLSGSSDGLVCTSNADEDDEDEAVLHVGNWGCSISQLGWRSQHQIWASSDMETFSIWSTDLDLINDHDIRAPSVHTQDRTWVTDYFITGHNPRSTDLGFCAFVGSNEGDIALISNHSGPPDVWTLHRLWTAGHTGVVRSVLWDEPNNVLITGGEDSKINLWPCPPLDDASCDVAMHMDDGQLRKKREWEPETISPIQGNKRAKHRY